jgi:hypothetical protein
MPRAQSWRPIRIIDRCQCWARTEGIWVETLMRGRVDLEMVKGMTAVFDETIAERGACGAFHDWWDVSGYDSACRLWWEGWLAAVPRAVIRDATVLARSRLVRMGITLANLKYPHITFRTFGDRAAYDRLRDREMRSPRPASP